MADNTTPLTIEERMALAVLSRAATPGPWEWNSYDGIFGPPSEEGVADAIAWVEDVPNTEEQHGDSLHTGQGRANAALIPACRNALPRLLATITTLERERNTLRADLVESNTADHETIRLLNAEVKRLDRMLRGLIPT